MYIYPIQRRNSLSIVRRGKEGGEKAAWIREWSGEHHHVIGFFLHGIARVRGMRDADGRRCGRDPGGRVVGRARERDDEGEGNRSSVGEG